MSTFKALSSRSRRGREEEKRLVGYGEPGKYVKDLNEYRHYYARQYPPSPPVKLLKPALQPPVVLLKPCDALS